jgi:hypothetical protein
MRQILQRAHHVLSQRTLATDMQDRAFRAEGRRDAGHGIRAARPGGSYDAAELAGLAGISVGGVRSDLFMAYVDDADALIDAAVIDVDDVATAQREDRVDALVPERLGDQTAARDHLAIPVLLLQRIVCGRRYRCHLPDLLRAIGEPAHAPYDQK